MVWLLNRDGLAAPQAANRGLPGLPHFAPKAKHVIYLFQNGAPTHVELFDYKPLNNPPGPFPRGRNGPTLAA